MPLYPNPATLPAGTTAGGDLTVVGNLTGQHDITASGTVNASAGNSVKLNAGSVPLTPTAASVLYGLATTGQPAVVSPSGQVAAMGGVLQAQTATVTVANSAAIAALTSYTVPANDVAAGALYRVTGYGIYSWTGTPTLTFALLWGGVAGTSLAALPAITLGTAKSNTPFRYTALVACRSTTSVWADLSLSLTADPAVDSATSYEAVSSAATPITSTGANALVVAVTWSAASSSNTISLTGGTVERIA